VARDRARTPDLEYEVEHHDDRFIIRTNADGATNFKLVTAPVKSPDRSHWKDWIAARNDVQIESFMPFKDYYVLVERGNALKKLRILDAATNKLALMLRCPSRSMRLASAEIGSTRPRCCGIATRHS